MKMSRRQVEVNLDELDRIIDRSMRAPLSESEGQKLKTALHAVAERYSGNGARRRPSPFCRRIRPLRRSRAQMNLLRPVTGAMAPLRLPAQTEFRFRHATLHSGDFCPECREGKVYRQKEPATLVRFVGQAPLEATVFEMERLCFNALRAGLYSRRTGDGGSGQVRRDGRGDDRAVEV